MQEKISQAHYLLKEAAKKLLDASDLMKEIMHSMHTLEKKPPLPDVPQDEHGNPTKFEPGKTITFAKEGERLKDK